MIKHILTQYLKSLLKEIFISPEKQLEIVSKEESPTKNIFKRLYQILSEQNELVFNTLAIKPDIFHIVCYPLKLVSGSVGRLKISGLSNAYVGGSLSLRIDNLFLLFHVDDDDLCDPEKEHILKKLYLEIQSKVLSDEIITALVYKLFNIPYNGDMKTAKKDRKVYNAFIKVISYIYIYYCYRLRLIYFVLLFSCYLITYVILAFITNITNCD